MMLNPKKCVFEVLAGKLLGFIVSQHGIEVNPEKTKAFININRLPILAAPEPMEPMLIYMAATNRVISIVAVVERKEPGHEYGVQRPVYCVIEVLIESKQRYPHYQKIAYGV